MKAIAFAVRSFGRELRSGEVMVLLAAVALAVGSVDRGRFPDRSHWQSGGATGERSVGGRPAPALAGTGAGNLARCGVAVQFANRGNTNLSKRCFCGRAQCARNHQSRQRQLSAARCGAYLRCAFRRATYGRFDSAAWRSLGGRRLAGQS